MDVFKMEHTVLSAAIPGPNPPDEVVSDRSNNNHPTQAPPSYEDPDDDDHQQFALPFFDSSPTTTTSVPTTTTTNGHHNCHNNVIPKKECFEERAPCVYESSSDVTPDTLFSEKDYGHYAASSPPPGLTVLYGATELKNQTQHHQHLAHQHHQQHHIHHQTQSQASLKTQPATSTTKSTAKADQSFAAPDSNSNTPTKTFIPCKVCGDKASGYHYGVTSCEGCKGFFRRSIQKQIEYRCLRDGKCLVIRLNRNRCQYCRFKKCLAVGMSRDSVRYGRVPKRNRERNDEARVTQSEADQSAKDAENKQLAIYDIILTVSQAHHANCSYTEERIRGLMRKPAIFNLSDLDGDMGQDTADSLENQKIVMWQHFAIYVTPSIQRVVEFAKRVPGFSALTQDDQLILIKAGFFEIWLLHIARMVNSIDNTMMFCDGSYVDRQQLDLVFDHEFVTDMFTFAMTFNNLQLNDTEIGLFAAVILLTYDRPGISDQNSIEIHREKLVEALRLQVARNHAGDAHFYPTVTDKVTLLRALGTRHAQHLHWFRINWAKLKLPPLFAEIFDIPKCEEDLQ